MTSFPGRGRRGSLLLRWKWALGLLLLGAALVVAACGTGQGQEPGATPMPMPSPSPSVSVSPSPKPTATIVSNPNIRGVDFSQVSAVKDLLAQTGGRLLPEDIIFADLTGDGVNDAVVPISSGGTAGNVAYAVFGYQGGNLEELLAVKAEAGRVTVSVQGGALVDTQPVYGPEDPLCCPSELRHTYYRWDGGKLVVDHETTETVPSAKP